MKLHQALFLPALFFAGTLTAKIGDPPPVVAGEVTYRSHNNYVEAVATGTERILWKTVLFKEGYIGNHNPKLEDDAQWNIISYLRLDGGSLVVKNGKREVFRLDAKTGKVLSK
jgi:hypothetical protein